MYNSMNQPQHVYNNLPIGGTPQFENNFINQTNMHTKSIPPTPPPDSSSRCMTPSNLKPGI